MSDEKIVEKMKKIYEDDEWTPDGKYFDEEIDGVLYKYNIKKQPVVEYNISSEIKKKVIEHDKLYQTLQDKKLYKSGRKTLQRGDIIKIFKISDGHTSDILFTSGTLYKFLLEKYEYKQSGMKTILDMFPDESKIKINLLETYYVSCDKEPRNLLNEIKKSLLKKYKVKKN